MKIRIVCIGKLKEGYMRDACRDYQSRLGRFCSLEITELPDERAPETLSEKQQLQLLEKEAARIEAALPAGKNIALAIGGKQYTSEGFAERIADMEMGGANVNFIIGGSLGISPSLLCKCENISLSALTFPHNLARLVLLEQLYRAMKINRNHVYHK